MEEARKLAVEVIAKLAKDAVSFLVTKAKDFYVDLDNKEQIDVGEAYENYLTKLYDTYSVSKTILYDDKPRPLSSFYVPADLSSSKSLLISEAERHRESGFDYTISKDTKRKKITYSTRNISDVFSDVSKLIVTGIGGMGKTMLMKHFCSCSIMDGYKIPVFISLRRFNNVDIKEKSLEKLIYDQLNTFGFTLDYKYFEYSLCGDRYLFLFDGFDEINDEKKSVLSFGITDFAKRYSNNLFVISSRQIDGIYGWQDFTITSICPMTLEQTVQLIWKLDFEYELKKRFIDELTGKIYDKYTAFASVPLLLSILFLTYVSHTKLPETLNEFYERAFETLLFKHDRRKIGFERIFHSRLTYEAFRKVFLCFCFMTYFKERYSFSYRTLAIFLSNASQKLQIEFDVDAYISDLVDITCMLIHDGQEYIFLHRSFQEYFTAVFVSQKTDEVQSKLCSSYLERKNELLHLYSDRIGERYIDEKNVVGSQYRIYTPYSYYDDLKNSMGFMAILYSVEPDRFESIVGVPIIQKIYKIYQNNNKNLAHTTRAAFSILNLFMKHEMVYFDSDMGLSNYEISVLQIVYDQNDKDYRRLVMENEDLAKQINNHEQIIDYLIDFDDIDKSTFLYCHYINIKDEEIRKTIQDTTLSIVWLCAKAIARYEIISQNKDTDKSFDELLDDFI